MTFKFTQYGIYNALLSLIPIFPVLTLFPTIGIVAGLESITGDCVLSYNIVMFLCIISILSIIVIYLRRLKRTLSKDPKVIKWNFRGVSLLVYMLTNTVAMIIILGAYLACNGSSMTIMVIILSAPIASVALILLGFLVDLRIKFITAK